MIDNKKIALAAFAPLARLNARNTIVFILESCGVQVRQYDSQSDLGLAGSHLLNLFKKNEIATKASLMLDHHFPFLQIPSIDKNGQKPLTLNDQIEVLGRMLRVLDYYRDKSVHLVFKDERDMKSDYLKDEEKVGRFLIQILTASRRKVKEKFEDVCIASGRVMINQESFRFFDRDRTIGKKWNEEWQFFPINRDRRLSEVGIFMLISLFTERRLIFRFLEQSGWLLYFKGSSFGNLIPQRRLVCEIFSAYSVRLPMKKLRMEDEEIQTSLDILNELKKCPNELYSLFSDEGKAVFQTVSSDGKLVVQKRYSDRFIPLALKYLDTTDSFEKLRFQVTLGEIRYELHQEASYIDGVTQARWVQERVNAFGRIQEIEAIRNQGDGRLLDIPVRQIQYDDETGFNYSSVLSSPHMIDSSPHYFIQGENVGISFGDYLPRIEKETGEKGVRYRIRNKMPDCLLSRYEIPALLFYEILRPGKAETVIVEKVESYRRLFRDIADGKLMPCSEIEGIIRSDYHISFRTVPEKIRDYLSNKGDGGVSFCSFKNRKVCQMLEEGNRLLREMEEREKRMGTDNKVGKRSYIRILPGKLASFLARDIILFQGMGSGTLAQKLTGKNFSILQGEMALFNGLEPHTKDELEMCFQRAGLLDDNTTCSHPFLKVVMSNSEVVDVVSLYKVYLQERSAFLSQGLPDTAQFLHPERRRWHSRDDAFYRDYARQAAHSAILLPRGLFCEGIRSALEEEGGMSFPERVNTAWMILEYYSKEGNQQDFYFDDGKFAYSENYTFNKLVHSYRKQLNRLLENGTIPREGNFACAIKEALQLKPLTGTGPANKQSTRIVELDNSELEKKIRALYNLKCHKEKTIRRYMVQDTVLFLAARRSLQRLMPLAEMHNLKLNDILSGRNMLDRSIDVDIPYRFKNDKGEHRFKLRLRRIKIKDVGEIYKLLRDSRVDTLLENFSKEGIEYINVTDLNAELQAFDKERLKVFALLFQYETAVLARDNTLNDKDKLSFEDIVRADGSLSYEEKEILREIRNRFAHNQYPRRKLNGKKMLYEMAIPGIAESLSRKVAAIVPK